MKAIEKIKKHKKEAWEWLENDLVGMTWSRYEYDKICMVDRTNNNASECFNSWILSHQDRPCLTMLEEVRCRLMNRFTLRRNEAMTWKRNLPPRVRKHLSVAYEKGKKMVVASSGDLDFQVQDMANPNGRRFIVQLGKQSCDCGMWEVSGLPCTHAMAAISHARHEADEHIPFYFIKQAYLNTCSMMFKSIPDEVTWDPCDRPLLEPPQIPAKTGRPKKARKRAPTEPPKTCRTFFFTCFKCKGTGHNARSCTGVPLDARPKQPKKKASSRRSGPGESSSSANKPKRTRKRAMPPNESASNTRGQSIGASATHRDIITQGSQNMTQSSQITSGQ